MKRMPKIVSLSPILDFAMTSFEEIRKRQGESRDTAKEAFKKGEKGS